MGLQDVVHSHARIGQQAVSAVAGVALGEHRRQVAAGNTVPRLAHDKQPPPHARFAPGTFHRFDVGSIVSELRPRNGREGEISICKALTRVRTL